MEYWEHPLSLHWFNRSFLSRDQLFEHVSNLWRCCMQSFFRKPIAEGGDALTLKAKLTSTSVKKYITLILVGKPN